MPVTVLYAPFSDGHGNFIVCNLLVMTAQTEMVITVDPVLYVLFLTMGFHGVT